MSNAVEIYNGYLPDLGDLNCGSNEDLQRTDQWFEARRGRFTGSGIKDLMTCSRSKANYEWGRPEKLIDFGEAAKKYIYSKFKERQRSKVVKTAFSQDMKYGTENEAAILDLLKTGQ